MRGIFKLLQPVFSILFYISGFFIILCVILSVILLFVNVGVEEMLLPDIPCLPDTLLNAQKK